MTRAANDSGSANDNLPMIERVERALLILAYLVEKYGDVHLAMYEQFEAKLQELQRQEDTKSRAKSRLQSFMSQNQTSFIKPPLAEIEAA